MECRAPAGLSILNTSVSAPFPLPESQEINSQKATDIAKEPESGVSEPE